MTSRNRASENSSFTELPLDVVDSAEECFRLDPDYHAERLAAGVEGVLEDTHVNISFGELDAHDHGEEVIHESLGNIYDIEVYLSRGDRNSCDDAYTVFTLSLIHI